MKEFEIEKIICNYAKEKGWIVYKFMAFMNKGVPDRIFLKKNSIFFIEFKTKKNKISKIQEKVINELINEEFNVFVVNNINYGKNIIDFMDKKLYE